MKAAINLAAFTLAACVGHASAADLENVKGPAAPAPFFFVNDAQISFWYESNAKEPGIFTAANPKGVSTQKGAMSITHFEAWRYGAKIDFLTSNNNDPATGSAVGAAEVYGLYRGTLSFNSILGANALTIPGVIKDVSLGFGFDANTKNTLFAPQKRDVVIGATFSIDAPGVFNVSARVQGLPLRISGFGGVTWAKGPDAFAKAGLACCKTTTEFLMQNRLTLDLGKVLADKPNSVDLFVGWQYWNNKFGNNHKLAPNGGSKESQFIVGMAWHAL